jgi:hypothetical protein
LKRVYFISFTVVTIFIVAILFLTTKKQENITAKSNQTYVKKTYEVNITTPEVKEKNITETVKDTNTLKEEETPIEIETLKTFEVLGMDILNDFNLTAQKENKLYIYKEFPLFDVIDEFKEPLQLFIMKRENFSFIEGYVLHKFEKTKYEIASVRNLKRFKYDDFPSMDISVLEKRIREKFNVDGLLNAEDKIFHLNNGFLFPILKFTSNKHDYYVNGNSGEVYPLDFIEAYLEDLKERERVKKGKELPLTLNPENGEVILDVASINREFYSEDDIKQIVKDLEIENQAIRDGLLKLDENLNLIYDKRRE